MIDSAPLIFAVFILVVMVVPVIWFCISLFSALSEHYKMMLLEDKLEELGQSNVRFLCDMLNRMSEE